MQKEGIARCGGEPLARDFYCAALLHASEKDRWFSLSSALAYPTSFLLHLICFLHSRSHIHFYSHVTFILLFLQLFALFFHAESNIFSNNNKCSKFVNSSFYNNLC
jgi:hypothetical protein